MNTKLCTIALILSGSVALSACQTIKAAPSSSTAPASYQALGTEPFWNVTVKDGSMVFRHPDGIAVRDPRYTAVNIENGWRFTGPKITMDVIHGECSDGMSDQIYTDRVKVSHGDGTFNGCGGGVTVPITLVNTNWIIKSIDGVAPVATGEAVLDFGEVRMSGTVGCNRFGAGYDFTNGKLRFSPGFSTMMACPDPKLQQQEGAMMTIIEKLEKTEFSDDGMMVLTATDGTKALLRQAI